ncbi:hypothetical protein GPJ56_006994 [Histomonas meleagridis]|uniref:uncharacterized protein n=1 Tax=Histomonas meleagridis TaxID=135588 RepID=UPI00355A5E5D|nr:hypothetical protein GPJ56_006994 [Histomonas meleagridis]KAH0796713.1 hypothetical protein GO595_010606 [Histomonas meleagridis]
MSSLIKFINLIKDPNEKDTIVTTLINEIFNSLQELKSGTLEIVLEFIEKLIVIAPLIHPNFWTLLNYVSSIMNNEVFILKGLKILENLVMKDPHTANVTENALQLLTLGINVLKIFSEFSNESSESIEFLARIFLFINYNDDIIIQAYNVLMPVVVKLVENPSQYNYTPSLMVSMLISHFDIFQQICGDNFWSIFGAWVENTSSVQLMTLIINTHEKFEQVDKKSRTSLIISAFKKAEVEDDIVRTAVEDEFELRLFDIHNTRVKFLEYLKTCDQQTMEEIQANINIDLEKFLTVGCPKTD